MTATLKLTPAAAGRMYHGPRYRRSADRIIIQQIGRFKASAEASVRYLGHVLEAIAKLKSSY